MILCVCNQMAEAVRSTPFCTMLRSLCCGFPSELHELHEEHGRGMNAPGIVLPGGSRGADTVRVIGLYPLIGNQS